jgi:hypothetical protein
VEEAVQADILCHLSDIASRLQRKVQWDPASEKFVDDPEADQKLRRRPMRKSWEVI